MAFWKEKGFNNKTSFYRFHFDLNKNLVDRYPSIDDFKIVSMKTAEDYQNQLLLRHNAFAGKNELSEEEINHIAQISIHSRDNPIYHADTDLCVVASNGRYV